MSRKSGGDGRPSREATNTFLRGNIWWARFEVSGKEIRGSLRTSDEATARKRAKELGLSEQTDAEQSVRFVDRLSRAIDSNGSHDKVAIGTKNA